MDVVQRGDLRYLGWVGRAISMDEGEECRLWHPPDLYLPVVLPLRESLRGAHGNVVAMATGDSLGEGLRLVSLVEGEVVNRFKVHGGYRSASF